MLKCNLEQAGILVPRGSLATSPEQARAIARDLSMLAQLKDPIIGNLKECEANIVIEMARVFSNHRYWLVEGAKVASTTV